jgi:eukaryotic-like serine/threonine-protein kinase
VTVLADRYELGDVLGEGGMGRVVAAHDRVLQRDVAVKLLTSAPDAASKARFLREARDSARLRHPNAVTVFDTGEHDGRPFIVMELVRGTTLAELVEREGPLDVEVAVAITAGVLEALGAAHDAGLVHRDVKPGNVMLPDDGGVKLADFGIAKAMDGATTSLTAAGTVLGTPSYLAPELVEGGTAHPASDLYAVGCLLYFQLAGEPPFTAENPLAIAYAHLNREVPPIEERRPDVPRELRLVLATALAKDPAERYGDATQMHAALLGGGPIVPAGEGTLPLTVALTPGDAAPGADGDVQAAPGRRATPSPGGTPGPAGSSRRPDADPTRSIDDGPGTSGRRTRSPWVVFALIALALFAIGAIVLAQSLGDDTDEPGTDDGSDQDGTDGSDEVFETDPPDPDADEPGAPDAPDDSGTPDEPGSGNDDPVVDDPVEPPADDEPPADEPPADDPPADDPPADEPPAEEPPAEEPPAGGGGAGGGQGPDGEGLLGQAASPGQEG